MTPQEQYERWKTQTATDPDAQAELLAIAGDEQEITDRFYRDLEFGTAGLRGILGIGSARMNPYTVGRASQGLAEEVKSRCQTPTAAIAYDSRNCSEQFARCAACVFAANGIKTFLFRELVPTPTLSYAVRELSCDTGVVITASHNPAAYNGYKVYDSTGCQIGPEQASAVQERILATDPFVGVSVMEFEEALAEGWIEYISDALMERFLDRVFKEALQPELCAASDLKVVYTPLNGAGNKPVRDILGKLGIREVAIVSEQELPDGNFPTCPYPNPETEAALALGLSLCDKTGADLLIATDPDCDRLGVAVRHQGKMRILTGNEVGILLLDYLCETRKKLGTMPKHPVALRSVVSTRMADLVAEHHGVEMRSVLTGFKYVGEEIAKLEQTGEENRFLFAFEESCGYLAGTYVRDKDAVNSSMLMTELAAACKKAGTTPVEKLEHLYRTLGLYHSAVDNFAFEGAAGREAMTALMKSLQTAPPSEIGGDAVVSALDYNSGRELRSGEDRPLPQTNMVELHLASGSSILIRPSGTEPKIKVYYTVTGRDESVVREEAIRLQTACKRLILG